MVRSGSEHFLSCLAWFQTLFVRRQDTDMICGLCRYNWRMTMCSWLAAHENVRSQIPKLNIFAWSAILAHSCASLRFLRTPIWIRLQPLVSMVYSQLLFPRFLLQNLRSQEQSRWLWGESRITLRGLSRNDTDDVQGLKMPEHHGKICAGSSEPWVVCNSGWLGGASYATVVDSVRYNVWILAMWQI